MQSTAMRVGQVAKRTGVSVRTLHYYDEIGLLSPSQHSLAGHRLYAAGDIARLQQIKSLQQIGLSLEEIRACLSRPDWSPLQGIELQIGRLRKQIELQRSLVERLEAIAARFRSEQEVTVGDLLKVVEEMNKVEKYYTTEQLAEIKERGRELGEDGIRQAEADWQQLIAEVRAEMDKGTDPTSERVRGLAQRWRALVHAFTGGNPEIHQALSSMWQQEENVGGFDTREMRQMMEYIGKASAADEQK